MLDRASLIIRGRGEQTKKRQQIDTLLKRAMKGNKQAKLKLYKEFGIKLYSSHEVDEYVCERVSQEYTSGGKSKNNGSGLLTIKRGTKGISKNGAEKNRATNLSPRTRLKEKTRQMVKKIYGH
jgi:hypothetical protein